MPSESARGRSEPHTTSTVLMIRPARFGANAETAATNAFQGTVPLAAAEILVRARAEFDRLVATLEQHEVEVLVVEDTPAPEKPDAVFPNNWISFHPGGEVVLYPLLAPSRQSEVRLEVLEELEQRGVYRRRSLLDLRAHAPEEGILEGTGSLVLDRTGRVAYACRSPRTSPALLARFGRSLGYECVPFHAVDPAGRAFYHTNVMMSVGTHLAVVCLEAIVDPDERALVERRLRAGGRELVAITQAQTANFAGNLLELRSRGGRPLFVLSSRARAALRPEQSAQLARHGTLVDSDLTTIELCGGGSARCMIAEVF